jgi:hypothetical protein
MGKTVTIQLRMHRRKILAPVRTQADSPGRTSRRGDRTSRNDKKSGTSDSSVIPAPTVGALSVRSAFGILLPDATGNP